MLNKYYVIIVFLKYFNEFKSFFDDIVSFDGVIEQIMYVKYIKFEVGYKFIFYIVKSNLMFLLV